MSKPLNLSSLWRVLALCLLMLGPDVALAKNPVLSNWMKNLSFTSTLEPEGTVWADEFGDVQAVGKTVHAFWYGRKSDWLDERFVYRRSGNEGATWKKPIVIASQSESPGSALVRDDTARYMCVTGQTVHIVIPRSFPVGTERSWYYNLYYYRSLDNGVSFEPARLLAGGADVWHITQPRIACNADRVVIGYKYAANWYNNYQIPLLISADGGATFGNATATASGDYSGSFEDLALSGTDIYVLHYRLLEPYYYGNFQARIALNSTEDDGATFRERWLTTKAADGRYYALGTKDYYNSPDLAVVGATVSVIWTQLDADFNGAKTLKFSQSLDKGRTFGKVRTLFTGDTLANGQATIAARGSHLAVVFPTTDGKVQLRRSSDGGATFKAVKTLSNEGGWWPEVRFAPDDSTGATYYVFWDSPSYRVTRNGGGAFDKALWFHPAFTTGNFQRSQRVVLTGGRVHMLTSGQFYSSSLCSGYCDRDMIYHKSLPSPPPGAPGGGLRLYTNQATFEDRADNMQALSKSLDLAGPLTVEIWVKDLGGGIGTGFTDYHTPILFKQRDLSTSYRPAFSLGAQDSYGARRIVADLETTSGPHRVVAQGDSGLLPPSNWTHLALVYQPALATDNLKLFKDGNLIASETLSGKVAPGFGNLFVGRYGNWVVDELRIWSVARDETELRTTMNGPLTGTETGLRAYYNFDGTTLDITGKGNDGVLMYQERYVVGRY